MKKVKELFFRKVDEVCSSEKVKVLSNFSDVWGAGPKTAHVWWDRWGSSLQIHITFAFINKCYKFILTGDFEV